MQPTIAPILSVRRSPDAVAFFQKAFDAQVEYLLDADPDSIVARLSVGGSSFWIAEESSEHGNFSPVTLHGTTARFVLISQEPEAQVEKCLELGSTLVWPVGIGHGWKLGRICDPFGHHREIGHPLDES